ncbi:selenium cofactor biosynthesis protein YqeC [Natroniella sulfidigena]|uniref:selenium cofactor biosynthesis protein YqeC n=1 Tax=Natroniella sulfidigena TaxID=723921 RepID=UPI00200A3AF2|nr:selenium cofactor biosynthesis protein YqeC [Natroniella sulfidigena]MCK8817587.1 selenium cofactor biosynthesis protein YqeC [Natroniella sulfidigena]
MLAQKLKIRPGEVVSIVGAGGKTSTLVRLLEELKELYTCKIIATTTTKMLFSELEGKVDSLLISDQFNQLAQEVDNFEKRLVGLAKKVTKEGKLIGLDQEWLDRLAELKSESILLVEADGAACRDFKIPNSQEPVVAESTDLLVIMVGMRIVGCELNAENLHRVGLLNKISNDFEIGQPITIDLIEQVLLAQEGYDLSGQQKKSRVVVILNQVGEMDRPCEATRLAQRLARAGVEEVMIKN